MKWESFLFFLEEKTDILAFSEQTVEPCSEEQGQWDGSFYRTSKDVQTLESKLETSSFRYIFKIFCRA